MFLHAQLTVPIPTLREVQSGLAVQALFERGLGYKGGLDK